MLDKGTEEDTRLRIHKQFNRVYISLKDMEQCVEFATLAATSLDFAVQRGLITAAIVSYARPFSGNEDHERATACPPFSMKTCLTPDEQELHARLVAIRNAAIAHSDFERNPMRLISYEGSSFLVASRLYDPLLELPHIDKIRSLAEKGKYIFHDKLTKLLRALDGTNT